MELFPVCLFLLAAFTAASSAGPQANIVYVAAGSKTFTLPLPAETVVLDTDKLIWKRNGGSVYSKANKKNKFTVHSNWALEVPAAELQVVGQVDVYTLEVHDSNGKEKVTMKTTLHLLEKVRTPTLTLNCTDKDNAVFHCFCNVSQKQDLVYKWTLSNADLKSEISQTLKVKRKDFEKLVTCEVSNKVGKERSAASEATCKGPPVSKVLHEIYKKYFWYIVGGGGGLVLLLFFITVLCCVRARSRRKHRLQRESEMRFEWTNQTPRQDQQQQRKKKKKKGPQAGGSQPHRCKPGQDANRPRKKDPAATPLTSKDHATAAASSTNPARPRPSPRTPQSERDGGLGVDHGPPLPKPRKKAGPKTNSRARP